MTRVLNKLSAQAVKGAGAGKYSDGGGLWIFKKSIEGGKWVLRVHVHGRRREMGLGPYPRVSLKEARLEADKWRRVSQQGKDPIKQRQTAQRDAERNMHILNDIARDAFESRKAELKGDGKAGRWFSPLEIHILPKLGKLPVSEIDQRDIRDTLAPIWHSKAVTARKAMNRLNICIRHAAALGLDVDIQATEKAKALLGKQRHKAQNIPALNWRQIEGDVWTIPADAMKGRKDATNEFRVPLSTEALAVIEQAKPFARDGYLFPSVRKGVISDATMARYMERRGMAERPHGFRSSFRDWTAEATNTPREVAETCLAHVSGGAVELAYRRTDFLEQRRALMERWGNVAANFGQSVVRAL